MAETSERPPCCKVSVVNAVTGEAICSFEEVSLALTLGHIKELVARATHEEDTRQIDLLAEGSQLQGQDSKPAHDHTILQDIVKPGGADSQGEAIFKTDQTVRLQLLKSDRVGAAATSIQSLFRGRRERTHKT
mmetsp:Transcript_65182/g.165259  ORF Transcript_65182/g.165259 Transcript_65182/m.165259 type:complete len:133 (-) Transcript_65182:49-447(-)